MIDLSRLVMSGISLSQPTDTTLEAKVETEEIQAIHLENSPILDGNLGEWQHLPPVTGFYSPTYHETAKEDTKVWIAYDKDNLYIAAHNLDSKPEKIRAEEIMRSGNISVDDNFSVFIDTYNQNQGAYRFSVNALGTQDQSIEGGSIEKPEWSGFFSAKSKITTDGWATEMIIPFEMLSYPDEQKTFGIMFSRYIARELEMYVWPKMEVIDLVQASDLTGLKLPTKRKPFKVMPNLRIRNDQNENTTEIGLDSKQEFQEVTVSGTYNPDFENVPSYIFDLSHSYIEKEAPETRPFFVDGITFMPSPSVFYAPRVGEIDWGLKTYGKISKFRFGIVGALDREIRNDFAANVDYNVTDRLEIGASAAHREEGSITNTVSQGNIGLYQPIRHGALLVTASLNHNEREAEKGNFLNTLVRYLPSNAEPGVYIAYRDITQGYTPLTGFAPETDLKGLVTGIEYELKTKGWIESIYGSIDGEKFDRQDESFYRDNFTMGGTFNPRNLPGFSLRYTTGERQEDQLYKDHTWNTVLAWNRHAEHGKGSLSTSKGKVEGQDYFNTAFTQEVEPWISELSIRGTLEYVSLGSEDQKQISGILSYKIDEERLISGRVVSNANGTNGYISYGQSLREGLDLSIVAGNPMSTEFSKAGTITATYVFNF